MLRAIGLVRARQLNYSMETILDIYTDYLQATFRQATATGLSEMLDGAVSHDQVTRMLSQPERGSKALWLAAKPLVRRYESEEGCLIFDDMIIEKPHTDESELVCWHFDHTHNRAVKGINLLTAFYHSQAEEACLPLRVPVAFETVRKPIWFCDLATRKEKRQSTVTKNELLRNMVDQSLLNQLKYRYILADSWFASTENMRFIHRKGKYFIFDVKCNRKAALSDTDRQQGRWRRIDELAIPEDAAVQVWLKDLEIPVILVKQVFINKDASSGVRYLVSNDLSLAGQPMETLYQKRWSVEEYHKSLKQNTAIAKSPTQTLRTQSNHLYASILAYIKFEQYKFASSMNHFAIKAKLYSVAIKAAFKELCELKNQLAEANAA